MAKDLFIFTLNSKGEFKRVKWEDVILTKIKETIVEGN